MEGNKSTDREKLDYRSFSGSILYDFEIFPKSGFNTYFGLGLGTNYFYVKRNYGNRISPVSSAHTYQVLDYIEGSGSRIGFNILGLFNHDSLLPDNISVVIKYNYVPAKDITLLDTYKTSINLSSIKLGVRFTIPFD